MPDDQFSKTKWLRLRDALALACRRLDRDDAKQEICDLVISRKLLLRGEKGGHYIFFNNQHDCAYLMPSNIDWRRGRLFEFDGPYSSPSNLRVLNEDVFQAFVDGRSMTNPKPAGLGLNSTDYKGRPACIYDGWCHVGCPIGALANPLVTYLADAKKAGAEVRPSSTVTRVLTNSQGSRVTGVEYYDHKKERQVQEASVVVLAAWAAQNPRMLLNSATDKHAKGLANSNGLVGKYMMTHFSSGTFAIFDEDVENQMGTTGAQYMSYDRYGKTSHKEGFGSSFIIAGAALKTSGLGGFANARLDLFGADLQGFMKRAARGFTRIVAFGEELPNIENRIELVR